MKQRLEPRPLAGEGRSLSLGALVIATVVVMATACSDGLTDPSSLLLRPSLADWSAWLVSPDQDLGGLSRPEADELELQEVRALQEQMGSTEEELLSRWRSDPTTPWTIVLVDLIDRYVGTLPRNRVATPVRASRAAVLLHVAIHDAMLAARHRKPIEARYRPSVSSSDVSSLVSFVSDYGFPSEHAAAAGAAAEVLAYVFPDEDPEVFRDLAKEAGRARVLGGANYPSDVEAGRALGQEVGRRVVEFGEGDGSDAVWTEAIPSGPSLWEPTPPRMTTPPYDPLAGTWRPWLLRETSQFRTPPPPELGSAPFEAAMAELRSVEGQRSEDMVATALYWATSAPSMRWHLYTEGEIRAHDLEPLKAAYVHTLVSVAMYDAYLACWEAKYHYWLLRPITVDPDLSVVFPTPPFPAYPSGHSTISAAAGEVLAGVFPTAAERNRERAWQASESRIWGGVHFRFDAESGTEQGREVAEVALDRARSDGILR